MSMYENCGPIDVVISLLVVMFSLVVIYFVVGPTFNYLYELITDLLNESKCNHPRDRVQAFYKESQSPKYMCMKCRKVVVVDKWRLKGTKHGF